MHFNKLSAGIILFLIMNSARSQGPLDSSPYGTTRDAGTVIYGTSTLGSGLRIPYESISGSPFWKTEFQMAIIYDYNNQIAGKAFSKLNLYSNELYFITPKGELRVAAQGKVSKVVFYKGRDTTSEVAAVFEINPSFITEVKPNEDNYVQVLNNGDVQLLKQTKILLMSGDSLMGTYKRYYFSEQVNYFINSKSGKNNQFRKLNRSNVLEILEIGDAMRVWLKENDINFKKEEEVIRFLNYYNAQKKG